MLERIQDFLSCRRIAIVGVSHNSRDFSRMLMRAFRERNFDVVPVNPNTPEIEGAPCYSRVQDIPRPVDAALLMTSAALNARIARDCVEAGVRRIWMYARSPDAEAYCDANGIPVISGECPMMFLPQVGWIHRVHRWFYDRRAHA
jgi:predicted CoA-binding protein